MIKGIRYNTSVNSATVSRLLAINRQFYQTFALQFSSTRQRLQPGVLKILKTLPLSARILDLGCGNGELARQLGLRGQSGDYLGLDFSNELLAQAAPTAAQNQRFMRSDLSAPGWDIPLVDFHPQVILAFAVLHHIPDAALRQQVMRKVCNLLPPGGRFIHSVWQFLASSRLRSRLQPWEAVNLSEKDVEPGDYLLDWRGGGYGLRYVHHFTEEELEDLALTCGFQVIESFYSDGHERKLGLYQFWQSK